MSEASPSAASAAGPPRLCRLPVERPAAAVAHLRARGGGVMDLIAHFWERLPQTPPLARQDLHLVVAVADGGDVAALTAATMAAGAEKPDKPAGAAKADPPATDQAIRPLLGAMLYVPKAYRADVLAPDPAVAGAFAGYIQQVGQPGAVAAGAAGASPPGVLDASGVKTPPALATASVMTTGESSQNGRCAIDFITGEAEGVAAMVPHLLPLVHKKAPAKQLVNIVMQLPETVDVPTDAAVRPAKDADLPTLNRWRRLYKEERGILFDADLDAWVETQRVFVLEHDKQIAAVAKFDLELTTLVEIGGVYTFPEFRNHGFAQRIMNDLAARVRAGGKTPTLQVDENNTAAKDLYIKMGWHPLGRLARVWLTGG